MKQVMKAIHTVAKSYTALLKKGWKKNWLVKLGVVFLVVLAWPLTLAALCFYFYNKSKNPFVQWAFVCIVLLVTLPVTFGWIGGVIGMTGTKATPNAETVSTNSISAPTSTPKSVEKFNIVVTSQIVKKVNGKYRYFFDIRNKDTKPFVGSVTIQLYNQNKLILGQETFDATRAIEPDLGSSQYIDAHTAPISQENSDLSISTFTYTVTVNNAVVNSGKGQVSSEFEDLGL